MKNSKINIHAAINIKAGIIPLIDAGGFQVEVSIKDAISCSQDEAFMFGEERELWHEILIKDSRKFMTKTMFKKEYSKYRNYYWNIDNDYKQLI